MKKMSALLFTAALVIGIASLAAALEKAKPQIKAEGENPGVIMTNVIGVEATVEAIDYKSGTGTLKGPQGTRVTLNVNPEDRKFNQVMVGHELVVQFTEAIAMNVKKPR